MWLSLLVSYLRTCNGKNQPLYKLSTKRAAAEAEGKLIQAGLKIILRQAMVGS